MTTSVSHQSANTEQSFTGSSKRMKWLFAAILACAGVEGSDAITPSWGVSARMLPTDAVAALAGVETSFRSAKSKLSSASGLWQLTNPKPPRGAQERFENPINYWQRMYNESFDKAAPQSAVAPAKFARGRHGMIATGSPYATAAAAQILAAGGNAIDASAAAHLVLMVVDPANTSLGGRTQILLRLRDGRVIPIDGATQIPAGVTPLSRANEERLGYSVVPVPGNLAALAEMVSKYGKLKWANVLRPAIMLAEQGFRVPPRLAATWASAREALRSNPGAAQNFLKPDGSAYQTGEVF